MVAQKRGHYVWWRHLAKVYLAPLGVTSLEYQQSVCYEKNESPQFTVWRCLRDMTGLSVLIERRLATAKHRQTDGHTHRP